MSYIDAVPIIVTENEANMGKAFQLAATPEKKGQVINDVALGQEAENIVQISDAEFDKEIHFSEYNDSTNASFDILQFGGSFTDDDLESDLVATSTTLQNQNYLQISPLQIPEIQSGANAYVDES